jgi:hypothetical protein
MEIGMMPSKLAQMMVNIAINAKCNMQNATSDNFES